jgi:2-haloacid dehalogenase
MLPFSRYRYLTFDCYGTLIDWETGIFSALRPILRRHNKNIDDGRLLELYGDLEMLAEQPYQSYRDVLKAVVRGFGDNLDFQPTQAEQESLPESLVNWEPWPDTVESLRKLKARYRLAIISNVDDDLFARTAAKLGVTFDQVITAQQARCYKPGKQIFELALQRIAVDPSQVLHVGQSIYHDVIPAKGFGLDTVWVNRASARPGVGAVKAATAMPNLEVPDLATLAGYTARTQPQQA